VVVITTQKVRSFLWRNIVCRFGVPKQLISDNGTQFPSPQVGEICEQLRIRKVFSSVEHPQSNGQAEAANGILLRGLRRRLEKTKGDWLNEIPRILWSYHTTPQSTT